MCTHTLGRLGTGVSGSCVQVDKLDCRKGFVNYFLKGVLGRAFKLTQRFLHNSIVLFFHLPVKHKCIHIVNGALNDTSHCSHFSFLIHEHNDKMLYNRD